ncbi:unnamed protein product [Leptosia nina]|uniref:Uncharacterized protein n=1 Tax=Leptosia nina TaxID=320188 RepID=A0AAV1K1G8_9NEOP
MPNPSYKCTVCAKFFAIAEDGVRYTVCNIYLHKDCPKATSPSAKNYCKTCLLARSKGNRNYVAFGSVTPIDESAASDLTSSRDVVAPSSESFECLKKEVSSLRNIIINFKSAISSQLTSAIASFNSRMKIMESRISNLEESVGNQNIDYQHSCDSNDEVESLKRRLNVSEHQCLINDVGISGVFEANGENTEHDAITLAQKIKSFACRARYNLRLPRRSPQYY